HALGQVVHVELPDPLFADGSGAERLVTALNHQLAGRVCVTGAAPAPPGFDARFSATWRAYRYLVVEAAEPGLGFVDAWSWRADGPIDLAAMNRAGAPAVGEHDFRAFCRRPERTAPGEAITRDVLSLAWRVAEDDAGLAGGSRILRLDIAARSFCHQMVRSLVSAMVAVGRGRLAEGEIAARLAAPSRDGLPAPAPAAGLCLRSVGYGDDPPPG
ncbi:MAG TPA: hypothetical protein VGS61_03290, partial [Acidimicrobiales bacterium]|nr:hypothetical protein [Acidimicrobiales bacterium]